MSVYHFSHFFYTYRCFHLHFVALISFAEETKLKGSSLYSFKCYTVTVCSLLGPTILFSSGFKDAEFMSSLGVKDQVPSRTGGGIMVRSVSENRWNDTVF